jgi:hypothetical protein
MKTHQPGQAISESERDPTEQLSVPSSNKGNAETLKKFSIMVLLRKLLPTYKTSLTYLPTSIRLKYANKNRKH